MECKNIFNGKEDIDRGCAGFEYGKSGLLIFVSEKLILKY
jgi:hypothetical protein